MDGALIAGLAVAYQQVLSLLIQGQEHFEQRARARFEKIWEPAFAQLEQVHVDYVKMLRRTRAKLAEPDDIRRGMRDALAFLADAREEFLPLRERLRDWAAGATRSDRYTGREHELAVSIATYFEDGVIDARTSPTAAIAATLRRWVDKRHAEGGPTVEPEEIEEWIDSVLALRDRRWAKVQAAFDELRAQTFR